MKKLLAGLATGGEVAGISEKVGFPINILAIASNNTHIYELNSV